MWSRSAWRLYIIGCCCLVLSGCYTPPSYNYEESEVYGRVMKDLARYPADNDEAYIPIKRTTPTMRPSQPTQPKVVNRPKPKIVPPRTIPREYEDNDAVYIPPKGKLARTPRQPYPQDNDATYSYPHGYKPKNGNGKHYPSDNDDTYVSPRGRPATPSGEDTYGNYPHDNESDMLDSYPLYFD